MSRFFSNTNRVLGFLIIVVSVISFLSLYNVTMKIAETTHTQCLAVHTETSCTVLGHIPYESFLGLGGLTFLGFSGMYIILKEGAKLRSTSRTIRNVNEALKNLDGEEKTIYGQIKDSDGFIFQNDLIQKTGFSKVKVSRLLDKLEAKNLVERRRRGMSNVVVLKY